MEARGAAIERNGLVCRGVTVAPDGTVVLRELTLAVAPGTFTVLVGPSGAGKTTLVRAIAGLEPVTAGSVVLAGRTLDGIPSHRRRLTVVFQTPRLFPNLDVAENVAFGLRAAGVARDERRERASAVLDEVGLAGFDRRAPRRLSGGEQQRVALARALLVEPDLIMLDEPLASVDPHRRQELRALIHRVQRERELTTLYVTHDQSEAAELGDAVALMMDGRILQHDRPEVLFERPASPTVARFFGSPNLLRGTVTDGRMRVAGAWMAVSGPDGEAFVTIRPEHVVLDDAAPLRARVEETTYAGTHVRVRLRAQDAELHAHLPPGDGPAAGGIVGVTLPCERLWRIPDQTAEAARPQRVSAP